MFGLGSSIPILAVGHAAKLRRAKQAGLPVATWGDSLTTGDGASTPVASYPAVAAASYSPARDIVNLGIGGQTSTQIAARQGGVPIAISMADDTLPAQFGAEWDFSEGLGGWASRLAANPPADVYADTVNAQLVLVGTGAAQSGAQVWLNETFQAGTKVRVTFELDLGGAASLEVGLVNTTNATAFSGGWSAVTNLSSSGLVDVTLTVGSAASQTANSLLFMAHTKVGTFRFRDVQVQEVVSVGVPTKSVNILYNSGNFSGDAAGSVLGVSGTMITDSGGEWTFERTDPGAAVAVPVGTSFIPDSAETYADQTAWIWAGRNNYSEPEVVKADIAAMIARLGTSRYLVAAILPSANDSASALATINTLNSDLKSLYRAHFVDVLAALQAHGDGSAEDDADIAAGIVPRSLRSDAIHLNDAGYAVVAAAFTACGI